MATKTSFKIVLEALGPWLPARPTKEDKMKSRLLSLPILLAGPFVFSTPVAATNLIGDVIFATYGVPCDNCNAIEQYVYSVDPFSVDAASQETTLTIIDGDIDTNGPEFFVLSGNPFGNVVGVTSPEPVGAHVVGGVLFFNWRGESFKTGDTITIAFGVPEVPAWAMMFLGFALLGVAPSIGNERAHAIAPKREALERHVRT